MNPPLPNQFLLYMLAPRSDGGNDKIPCDLSGRAANAHDQKNWTDFQTAKDAAARLGPQFGVAFDLTDSDPWFFLDLDKCLDPVSGQWKPEAVAIFNSFQGAWGEVSSSGTGLHVVGRCRKEDLAQKRNKWGGWLEFYTRDRFIAFGPGGWSKIGQEPNDPDFTDLLRQWVPDRQNLGELPVGVDSRWTGPTDDDELIQKMLASSSHSAGAAFSGRATAADLWNARTDVLARTYPAFSGNPSEFDHSAADAALMSHLAFWTGRDMPRMDRLFRRSGLMREKYETRPDYRSETIQNAARLCQRVYDVPRKEPVAVANVGTSEVYLTIPEQITHFAGCVYIRDLHRVLVPGGTLLKPEQFNASFGGHIFQMQPDGTGPTKKAFEAFTENRAHRFPRANRPCFRPDLDAGLILGDGSVNTYYPPDVTIAEGDVTPFLDLLRKLLPIDRDRLILTSYLAAVVQYPGTKFQWAPVLQGCEGNGKTLVFSTVGYTVGKQYTHSPKAEQLAEKFNAYIEGKVFILVEEVHMQGKREMLDVLKPLVTNLDIEIRGMAQEKRMIENRANWGFCTNYKDAVLKSKNDRRYAVFFTAQQQIEDLHRDGMDGRYFPDLYAWCRGGGYAAVAHYLKTFSIPDEFNPATNCHRAPDTSSTVAAIKESLGGAELEIIEATNDNSRGFRAGWISSWALDLHLSRRGFKLSRNRQSSIMRDLGYVEWGRAPRAILEEDGKRPVLYRRSDAGPGSFEDYLKAQAYA